jgi:8-oxo-dGTP pyrophosphatase MutT (NUDIX family)
VTNVRHRRAGRAIVRSADGRVLMMRGEDPGDLARGGFWFTPGGGLSDGESIEDGVRRELVEETGLAVTRVGPVVMRRRDRFAMLGEIWLQEETIHLVEVDAVFEPWTAGLEALEASVVTEFRWFSTGELRSLDENFYPRCLADLLDEIEASGPPKVPWFEDLTEPEPLGE